MIKKHKNMDNIMYLLLLFLLIFVPINTYPIINIVLFTVIGFYLFSKKTHNVNVPILVFILMAFIFLILIQSLLVPSEFYSYSNALEEVFRIIIYILVVLFTINLRIHKEFFIKSWIIFFALSAFIAIFQFFNLFNIHEILSIIYGDSNQLQVSMKYDDLSLFRAGSIFSNPNSFAKFILLFIAIYIIFIMNNKKMKKISKVFLIGLIISSLILAGSRTGLIISVLMMAIYIIFKVFKMLRDRRYRLSVEKLIFFYIAIASLLVVGTYVLFNFDLSSVRFFSFGSVYSGSVGYKLSTLMIMLNEFNVVNIFIGLGPFEGEEQYKTLLDSDIGYLIAFYGLGGVILYIYLLYKIIISSKHFMFIALMFTVLILFSFTGGTFFNIRFFTVFLILFFTNFKEIKYESTSKGIGN